jgi:hypothetical protein
MFTYNIYLFYTKQNGGDPNNFSWGNTVYTIRGIASALVYYVYCLCRLQVRVKGTVEVYFVF